ncbi:MAG: ATP-binding cassette domain-containing protein [Candidatus Cloacimonetes bacterium]|nr:ATP-binding cassette domain-containing protein [Candidatus Cloacimonadota bacterium]
MIEVRGLSRTFKLTKKQRKERLDDAKTLKAVDDISFTSHPGRVFALLGPNGAGKTTTLRIISALLQPSGGTVKVCGHDISQREEVHRCIGFFTGSTKLYDRLTPYEMVRYFADLHKMPRARFEVRVKEYFDLLDMQSFAHRRIGKLSGGMKQKVSVVRTIIHDPDVVILDEATVGLDVIAAEAIIAMVRMLRDQGKTVIFSTHIMGEVSLLADDLAIIANGRLVFNDTWEAFRASMQSDSLEREFIRVVHGENAQEVVS